MPIEVGMDNVSIRQRKYLELARSSSYSSVKARGLWSAISIPEVQSGREMVHPDWIEIYQSIRNEIPSQSGLSSNEIIKMHKIFGELLCDDEISTVDPQKMHLAFLLGAGASKPTPSDIPTVKELLPDLLMRARRLDRADFQRLADFCDNSRIDNIEDLLTAAQLSGFCGRNPSVLNLVGFLIYGREADSESYYGSRRRSSGDLSAVAFLQDTLQVLFGLLSSKMLPAKPNPGHIAIAKYVHDRPESSIITTNYDCCVDLALRSKNAKFSYLIEFANAEHSEGSESDTTPCVFG